MQALFYKTSSVRGKLKLVTVRLISLFIFKNSVFSPKVIFPSLLVALEKSKSGPQTQKQLNSCEKKTQ